MGRRISRTVPRAQFGSVPFVGARHAQRVECLGRNSHRYRAGRAGRFDPESAGGLTGVERRFHLRGEVNGITVVDDYGHHPTEVKATLAAAKQGWRDRRLVVLFQPHRYSRTRDLLEEFTHAFDHADLLFLTEIYAAGEQPIPGRVRASS